MRSCCVLDTEVVVMVIYYVVVVVVMSDMFVMVTDVKVV